MFGMFNHERSNKTVDQIDFSKLGGSIKNDSLLPYELRDCISNAIENKDFQALRAIYDKSY